jgi:hypothetical protein
MAAIMSGAGVVRAAAGANQCLYCSILHLAHIFGVSH